MKKIFLTIAFAFFTIFLSNITKAQQTDITYFMRNTPFAYNMNPAIMPSAKIYINYPLLSGINFNFRTSGFAYSDIITRMPNDSLKIDINNFYKTLTDRNYFMMGGRIDIIGFGFNMGKKNYLSISADINYDTRFSFSKDLLGLLVEGNNDKFNNINILDKEVLNLNAFFSVGVGYTRVINEKVNVGARAKLLFGIANISTEESKLQINQNGEGLTLQSNFLLRTSNIIGKLNFSGINDSSSAEFTTELSNIGSLAFKNIGLGFDFGASYKLNEKMLFSFAIQDLGYINWKTNNTDIVSKNPDNKYTFKGFEHLINGDTTINYQFEQVLDSLIKVLDIETQEGKGYTKMIPTKIYLGYSWNFAKTQYLNALYRGVIGNGISDNYLSVFYSLELKQFLNISLGNTFSFENNFNNIKPINPSVALNVNAYAFNLYLGGAVNSSFNVAKMTGLNFFFGINLALGYNDPFKTDKPKEEKEESKILEKD